MANSHSVEWPDGRKFAFTVFDDPDAQTTESGRIVYAFLRDLGFRTTKGVWPLQGRGPKSCIGECCEDELYLQWCLELQREGFEIGYHNASQNSAPRALTQKALEKFSEHFGQLPVSMSNHYNSLEGIYWGDDRLSGLRRLLYNGLTRFGNHNRYFGHREGHELFWGDLCQNNIQYVRNFVFRDINTLKVCPAMPYFDPMRPYVNAWYASSEGSECRTFVETISEANQDRLVAEGGACIMYTHFGHGYVDGGKLNPRFRELMTRLSRLDGWFVPVASVLGHLRSTNGRPAITPRQRADLEWRWLLQKVRHGTS